MINASGSLLLGIYRATLRSKRDQDFRRSHDARTMFPGLVGMAWGNSDKPILPH